MSGNIYDICKVRCHGGSVLVDANSSHRTWLLQCVQTLQAFPHSSIHGPLYKQWQGGYRVTNYTQGSVHVLKCYDLCSIYLLAGHSYVCKTVVHHIMLYVSAQRQIYISGYDLYVYITMDR